MIHIRNHVRKITTFGRLSAFFCLLVCVGILSGCSKETEGTIYLSGTSMFKITVGSSSGAKEAEALNKAGKPLLDGLKWKGKPETEVLDTLVQKMQGEDAEKIYIDVLSTDKSWAAGEISRLSEFFSEDSYESAVPVEIRSASELDEDMALGTSSFGDGNEEQRLSLSEESRAGEEEYDPEESGAEETNAQDKTEPETSPESVTADESAEDGSNLETSTAAEEQPATVQPATVQPTTARPTEATTAEAPRSTAARPTAARPTVPRITAPARTKAPTPAPETTAPETAAPAPEATEHETAAPETQASGTKADTPETTVPETAAASLEAETQNGGNGEAAASTRIWGSDVYIPTRSIEDDQSFGPGW